MDPVEMHNVAMGLFKLGHEWQEHTASFFRRQGLPAFVPPLEVREKPSTEPYKNEKGDLWIGDFLIEVKALNQRFTYPGDYKYQTVFVDAVSGWDRKVVKPRAYIIVSRSLGTMMCLSVKQTFKLWTKEKKYLSNTEILQETYLCDRKWWFAVDELVDLIKFELGIN